MNDELQVIVNDSCVCDMVFRVEEVKKVSNIVSLLDDLYFQGHLTSIVNINISLLVKDEEKVSVQDKLIGVVEIQKT